MHYIINYTNTYILLKIILTNALELL